MKKLRPHLIIGDAQRCIEALERYHEEFGVDYFTMRFRMVEGPVARDGGRADQTLQRGGGAADLRCPAPDHPAIPEVCRW